jgi:hypothetical protein
MATADSIMQNIDWRWSYAVLVALPSVLISAWNIWLLSCSETRNDETEHSAPWGIYM